MNKKFKDVGLDEDTRLLGQKLVTVEGIEVLCQCWIWDGIKGWSAVFVTNEIQDKSDDELIALVKQIEVIETAVTIKRSEKWTFVNFNFSIQ